MEDNPELKLRSPAVRAQELDLGLERDQELGCLVADAKLIATRRSFDSRYREGISSFVEAQGGELALQQDQQLGQQLAAALLEERRKTLVAIATRGGIFAGVSFGAALLVGLTPVQSSLCLPVSVVAAIATGRKP